jgi:CheY-like chemotaxis protein
MDETMFVAEKGPRKQRGLATTTYRKILWGIRKNQAQLEKLVDVIQGNLNKALPLAQEEKQRLEKEQNPTSEWTSKEIQYLKHELNILKTLKTDLDLCRKNWPMPEIKPIRKKPIRKKISARPTAKTIPKTRSTILVIDDEKIAANSIRHFLRQKDYQVIVTLNAEEGLEKAQTENPDLILLDIMMPGMNGYQFLSLLKQDKSTADIPVIIVSALSRETDILEGLDKGADDYIIKPYSPQVLISKVTKILSR